MKSLYAVLLAVFLLPVNALAQEPPESQNVPPAPITLVPLETVMLPFVNELNTLGKRVDNVDKEEYYSNWEAYDTGTQQDITISDLNDRQKRGFFIYQSHIIHNELVTTSLGWNFAISHVQSLVFKDDDPMKTEKEAYYDKLNNELSALLDTLSALHTKLAKKREAMITEFIDITDDKSLKKELQKYHETVIKEHDKLNLIDRGEN